MRTSSFELFFMVKKDKSLFLFCHNVFYTNYDIFIHNIKLM
jgi:hypothetical protein